MIPAFLRRSAKTPHFPETHGVSGRTLPLKVTVNARATRLTLRVAPGARGLAVTVPPGVGAAEVARFLERHTGWLEARLAAVPDKPQVREGILIPIAGVKHRIVHEPGRGVTEAVMGDDGPLLVVRGERASLGRRVADYLKKRARAEIEPRVARHAGKLGRKVASVRYKDTVSRWGSCTSDGNLSFCWRIAMAPPAVIDYLVAHECAHLREMNHGPKFWALTEELCPGHKRPKDWLKRNGAKLQAMEF